MSVSHQTILRYLSCYAAVDESRLCKEYSTKTEKRASLPILIQVLLQSRPIANHTNMESLHSLLLLQALVSLFQICLLLVNLSQHRQWFSQGLLGLAHSQLAKLRVGPEKEWDLEWSRTKNSNESHTHFSGTIKSDSDQWNTPPPISLLRPRAVDWSDP